MLEYNEVFELQSLPNVKAICFHIPSALPRLEDALRLGSLCSNVADIEFFGDMDECYDENILNAILRSLKPSGLSIGDELWTLDITPFPSRKRLEIMSSGYLMVPFHGKIDVLRLLIDAFTYDDFEILDDASKFENINTLNIEVHFRDYYYGNQDERRESISIFAKKILSLDLEAMQKLIISIRPREAHEYFALPAYFVMESERMISWSKYEQVYRNTKLM